MKHIIFPIERYSELPSYIQRMEENLAWAAKNDRALVSIARSDCGNVYQFGSDISPAMPAVARALSLAAQALTARFVFKRPDDNHLNFVFDTNVLSYTMPIQGQPDVQFAYWQNAVQLSWITRQPRLIASLRQVEAEDFMDNSTNGDVEQGLKAHRAVINGGPFSSNAAFQSALDYIVSLPLAVPGGLMLVKNYHVTYYRLLEAVDLRDKLHFLKCLAASTEAHRVFWNRRGLKHRYEGIVDLRSIAACSLAWDAGMRWEEDFDYVPRPWFEGEMFKNT